MRRFLGMSILGFFFLVGCSGRDWTKDAYRKELTATEISMIASGAGLKIERIYEKDQRQFGDGSGNGKPEYVEFDDNVPGYLKDVVATKRSIVAVDENQKKRMVELIDRTIRVTDYGYGEGGTPACGSMKPGIHLHYQREEQVLDVYICMMCNMTALVRNGDKVPFLFVVFEQIDDEYDDVAEFVFDEDPKNIR